MVRSPRATGLESVGGPAAGPGRLPVRGPVTADSPDESLRRKVVTADSPDESLRRKVVTADSPDESVTTVADAVLAPGP